MKDFIIRKWIIIHSELVKFMELYSILRVFKNKIVIR